MNEDNLERWSVLRGELSLSLQTIDTERNDGRAMRRRTITCAEYESMGSRARLVSKGSQDPVP
jgi:hypothetical protein